MVKYLFLVLTFFSCATDQELDEQLDVGMAVPTAQSEQMNLLETEKLKMVEGSTISTGDSVTLDRVPPIDWKRFFKPPPSDRELKVIEKKIRGWSQVVDTSTLLKRAHNEFSIGQFAKAEGSFRQVLRQDEHNNEALLGLSQVFLKKQDLPQVFEFLAQIKNSLDPDLKISQGFLFKYRYTLAVSYIQKGNFDKGHSILSDLIAIDSKFSPSYAALSSSYLSRGKLGMAEFIAKRGIDQAGDSVELLNLLGVISEQKGQNSTARTWYDKALKIRPNFPQGLINRAGLSIKKFEYSAAEQDLIQAIRIDPLSSEAFTSLGIVQKKTGRMKAAKASFMKSIEIEPENAVARLNLAVMYADYYKNSDVALRMFNEVLQTNSVNQRAKDLAALYIQSIHDHYVR